MLKYLGYDGQNLDEAMNERIDRAISICENELHPQGIYRIRPISRIRVNPRSGEAGVWLEDRPLVLPGNDIANHLQGADSVAIMVVTLGLDSERVIRREEALSVTDGLLVDAAASAMVESAIDELQREIAKDKNAKGLVLGPRFGPGYGDLPLKVQGPLLDELNATRTLGVSVLDEDLLLPSKSTTAVSGVFSPGVIGAKDAEDSGAEAAEPGASSRGDDPFARENELWEAAFRKSATNETWKNGKSSSDQEAIAERFLDPRCASCLRHGKCALRAEGKTCFD